jgi:hypothetical protein
LSSSARLVGLERLQRLDRAVHALAAGDDVRDLPQSGRDVLVEVDVVAVDRLLAGAPDRHRLVLDHDPQPRTLGRAVDAVQPPQVDLERALVGVERVVMAEREVVRRAQQRPAVLCHHRRDASLRILDPERRPSLQSSCSQRVPPRRLELERKAGLLGVASWLISANHSAPRPGPCRNVRKMRQVRATPASADRPGTGA